MAVIKGKTQIPTFILGITSLYPHLRSNLLFALAFFSTRILFHLVLIVSFLLPESRMQTVGGSYVPAAVLAMIFPLHAMWFSGCIKGFYKRAHKKVEIIPSVIALDMYSDDVSTGVPSTPKDSRQTHTAIIPIARRRQSYGNEAREREDGTGLVLVGGYVSLPGRETVFDFVGLGRGSKQDQ
ncbi:hypothetical protein BDQ12DRAFT_504141 [Crucibulum laeve]|uniref:TLC domain-containing protein n=1 Tax=Crucibulum laeve TaxID=68775 RepID=A0A5C3LH05_9AGAR|nr:hypothetical protein BDQ12DRAFT_504141 [Crucibulum laeve]